MSGICGIVNLDGRPVGEGDLCAMLAALERRGPDGSRTRLDGASGFGHSLLATTPEAMKERLPLKHEPTGCTITADVRLDNREDLIASLGLGNRAMQVGDGEVILQAFLKWGTTCVDRLRGDFAFAIWDPRDDSLFCARDLIGMRSFNYSHQAGKLFAFATEPEAILHHPDVPTRINEGRIADYLEDLEAFDLSSTFFSDCYRLPPAHALTLRGGDVRIWRYTQLKPQTELRLPTDEAYAEAFLDVFTKAVAARLRSPDPVASMLSGGMDSGSVTALAAQSLDLTGQPPLHTFSAIGTDNPCPETRAIRAAQSIAHIEPHSISVDGWNEFEDEILARIRSAGEPFDGHMTLLYAIYLMAQKAGAKVVLDGVGGDTTLGTQNMIAWHLRKGHVRQAWKEAAGEEQFWDHPEPALRNFVRSLGQVVVPKSLRDMRHSLHRRRAAQSVGERTLLSAEFADRINLTERLKANAAHVLVPTGDTHADRERRILHPYVTVARERYDRVASAMAIEPRDPFLDRGVMEFCLSLPADQLQRNGWPKFILRKATKGILPDAVRWRIGKEHLGWDFTKALWQDRVASPATGSNALIDRFVERSKLANVNSSCEDDDELATYLSVQYLSHWMSMRGESTL